jgi:hypothetical protein
MHQSKSFRAKPLDQIKQESHVRDVFLAEGDAMALPAGKLMAILDLIHPYLQKGETYETSLTALLKLQQASSKRSVMILLGLGGRALSESHADASARLCSAAEPEYVSVLTTSFPRGQERVQEGFQKELGVDFQELDARKILQELELYLFQLDLPQNQTIFRSDHASNYLVLKGRLGREQGRLLKELRNLLDAYNI